MAGYQEEIIDFEVLGVGLRFDESSNDKGLAAIELKGLNDYVEIKAYTFDYGSTGWYELGSRLVGFETKGGMSEDNSVYNIRQIRPLTDSMSCNAADTLKSDNHLNEVSMSLIASKVAATSTTYDLA